MLRRSVVFALSAVSATSPWASKSFSDEDVWTSLEQKVPECPVCSHFMRSPCASEFTDWNKCVVKSKRLKADITVICDSATENLMKCTSVNPEYFDQKSEQDSNTSTDR
jgi:hypothetical protein